MTDNMQTYLEKRIDDIVAVLGNKTATWDFVQRVYGEAGLVCLYENYTRPTE